MTKPVFEHRHYKAIAACLADMQQVAGMTPGIAFTPGEVVAHLAMLFASDNPRFDCARFLAAASGKPSNGRDKVRS